jgi:hypothetical protein
MSVETVVNTIAGLGTMTTVSTDIYTIACPGTMTTVSTESNVIVAILLFSMICISI